ncbi:MAG: substrate-binding domain-containing protein [Novosphingobium sp.]
MPHTADNSYACIQAGILQALADTGHALVPVPLDCASPGAVHELFRVIERLQPQGIVLPPPASDSDELVAALQGAGYAHVSIAPDARVHPAQLACSNDRQAMCDAANYLIALGHRRIGFVSISDESRTARERELGFIDALAEHGLDFGAELVVQSEDTAISGLEAGLLLLNVSPRPSAVLAASDTLAAGVLQAAARRKIAVPDTFSVMGFGDADLAPALTPPLTSMRVPYAEMGFTAAVKLLDPTRAALRSVEFLPRLVSRGSTGPIAS